ncbi:kinase-like protein [Auriscalpium vulgare]|uniref:Kinase-like protein n=1 Tax=Auriscalpium vulgare TaxID=40419 RepID=A0ACB8RX57_9AGAM|nr:kinase-like protein [Auriscalpium vulgare]
MSHSSTCSTSNLKAAFISSLDAATIQGFAVTARRDYLRQHDPNGAAHADLSCTVVTPPASGTSNVAYTLDFSDGVNWVLRIPFRDWSDIRARRMRLDIVAQQYILSRTSVPIPPVYSYDCTNDNALGHPYVIMAFVHGTRLADVWDDPTWWTGERTKARLLKSFARHMVELASLEFDAIGCLDKVEPDGPYFVAPFPTMRSFHNSEFEGPDSEAGPFDNAHNFIQSILDEEFQINRDPFLAALHIFLNSLLERQYDRAPFILGHPDLVAENVFVDETGEVSAIIDWDGVAVLPRQLGALAYPAWLTIDWNPLFYFLYQYEPHHHTREELHMYRNIYVAGIAEASDGRLAAVTRNSHITCCLVQALASDFNRQDFVYHLGRYMFGLRWRAMLEGMKGSPWFNLDPNAIAQVTESDVLQFEVPERPVTAQQDDLRTSVDSNDSDGESDDAGSRWLWWC